MLAVLLAGCPLIPVTYYFNNTPDIITVHGQGRTVEWQPGSTLREDPSQKLERSITGRELPERLKVPSQPKGIYGLLDVERAGVMSRYALIFRGLPEGYVVRDGARTEVFLQLEPDGRLYAVTKEQLGTKVPPGTPLSPFWVEPID